MKSDKEAKLRHQKNLSNALKSALSKIKKINAKISDYESKDDAEKTLSKLKDI
jgi:hypothetical protein